MRGKPAHDTLAWWLQIHGGVDAVLQVVAERPEPPARIALQWNAGGSMVIPDGSGFQWEGSWEVLKWDADGGWMIFESEFGEAGDPY